MKTLNPHRCRRSEFTLSQASLLLKCKSTPADQQKVGTISPLPGLTSALEDQLAQKLTEMGAKSFRITSVTGPNTLHGTAVIYK